MRLDKIITMIEDTIKTILMILTRNLLKQALVTF